MLAGYVLMTFFFGLIIWFMCRKNAALGQFAQAMMWAFVKSMIAILAAGVAAGLLLLGVIMLMQSMMFDTAHGLFSAVDLQEVIGNVTGYIGSTLVSLYLVFVALHYKKK